MGAGQDWRKSLPKDLCRTGLPTAAEVAAWSVSAASPFSELLARHRQELAADAAERRAVADKAALDAFGAQPGPAATGGQATPAYLDVMRQHLRWLADHPEDYVNVVQRAYRFVLRRDAYLQELHYWKRYSAKPFVLLAACIDNWARRNQPGLPVTSGPGAVNVNSRFFVAVQLSPAVAVEVRAAAGFARPRGSAAALGRHVVAPGADDVASVGRDQVGRSFDPVCFTEPSNYEITAFGKKLIGSAQARRGEAVLQHGTLPLSGDLRRIVQVLRYGSQAERQAAASRLTSRAVTIEEVLGRPVSWEEAAAAMQQGFQEVLGLAFEQGELSSRELKRAAEIEAQKYASQDWTERI